MLIDLETLHVVVCHTYGHGNDQCEEIHCCLDFKSSAESPPGNHHGTSVAEESKEYNQVSVDAVEYEEFVADNRHELPNHEKAARQTCCEVECYSDSSIASMVEIPFSRRRVAFKAAFCIASNIHVGHASKEEPEHCTAEDND